MLMNVDVFAKGPVTSAARIRPLARALRLLGVECRIVPPIPWNRIARGKIGNVLSSLLSTHFRELQEQ